MDTLMEYMNGCCITATTIAKQKARHEIFLKVLHIHAHLRSEKLNHLAPPCEQLTRKKLHIVIALGQFISFNWNRGISNATILETNHNQ